MSKVLGTREYTSRNRICTVLVVTQRPLQKQGTRCKIELLDIHANVGRLHDDTKVSSQFSFRLGE